MLMSNGLVRWVVPVLVTTGCLLNVKMFPFDSQQCWIDLSSSLMTMTRDMSPVGLVYDEYLQPVVDKSQELQVTKLNIIIINSQ